MQMLSPQVPALVGYLGDQSLTEALMGALVDVSRASPSSMVSFLPALRTAAQQCPALLGHVAKIHGAVGIISEVQTLNTPKANVLHGERAKARLSNLTCFDSHIILFRKCAYC